MEEATTMVFLLQKNPYRIWGVFIWPIWQLS